MQPIFPTTYSTLSPDALADYIGQRYTLESVKCQFIVRGVGDTYLVTSSGKRFILRIYRSSHRTLGNIQAEVSLLNALHMADVSVSYPVADKEGGQIQALQAAEGIRHAVLFTYAEGRSYNILSDNQLRNFGKEMARFHNVSAMVVLEEARWTLDTTSTLDEPLAAAKDYFKEDPATYAWLLQAVETVKTALAAIPADHFSSGYCHFDFLPKNFHFDTEDRITFFDFDFFGRGWLIYDIMTFRQQLLLDKMMGRLTDEQLEKTFAMFLEAYRSERDLSEEEQAAIPYLGLGFWIFYMGFHMTHDQFYPHMQLHMLQSRFGLIRKLMEEEWKKAGVAVL
jgi:Ser/Thr protein kinase RdoA (MazF antagonist)